MTKLFLIIGALLGAISVMVGAFGAHGLKVFLENSGRLDTFETAVKYQFYHSFALLILGVLMHKSVNQNYIVSGWLFITGTLIFSGSLYILCITGIRWLGAITPFGGLALIGGWIFMAIALYKTH